MHSKFLSIVIASLFLVSAAVSANNRRPPVSRGR